MVMPFMTPFDTAWALLKMPLDYDSIEQVGEKDIWITLKSLPPVRENNVGF